jgi:hypothetical protein
MRQPLLVPPSRFARPPDHRSWADPSRPAANIPQAVARIPLYLLIDRQQSQVTLFGEPVRDDYFTMTVAAFGAVVKLPAPVLLHAGDS